MKKHILGIAVFSLIVGFSIFIYQMFAVNSVKTDCFPQFGGNSNCIFDNEEHNKNFAVSDVNIKILSVKYDSATNSITEDIRFYWVGAGTPPKTIFVNSQIYSPERNEVFFGGSQEINLQFSNRNFSDVLVYPQISTKKSLNPSHNYYVGITLSKEKKALAEITKQSTENSSPILFAH